MIDEDKEVGLIFFEELEEFKRGIESCGYGEE